MDNTSEIKFGHIVLLRITSRKRDGMAPEQIAIVPGISHIHQTHVGSSKIGTTITLHYRRDTHRFIQFTHVPSRWMFKNGEVRSCTPDGKIMIASGESVVGHVTEGNLALDGFLEFLQLGGRAGQA